MNFTVLAPKRQLKYFVLALLLAKQNPIKVLEIGNDWFVEVVYNDIVNGVWLGWVGGKRCGYSLRNEDPNWVSKKVFPKE